MLALWMLGVSLVVVVSSALTPTPNIVPAGLPTTQIGALRTLYDATAGTGWKYDNPEAAWSFASSAKTQADPCLSRWAGVLCDSKNSSVIALDVNSMGLVGTLPEKIGALTALTYLDASYNSLSGTLPAGLFLLTMLLFCQIESNQLEGSLPADIGQLTALQILSLFDNKLEGTLSPAVGQLKALNELYLPYNSLSGSLPVELFGLKARSSNWTIALLTADSQCFGLAFSAPSPVTSSYEYAAGVDYARGKYDYHLLKWINPDIMATAYISYQPSFRYVYGCSAALVTTYASVFVNMALISCVAGPLCWVTVRNLIDREWLSKDFGARVLPALIQTSQERRIRRGKQGDRAHLSYNIIDTHQIFLEVLQDLIALHTFGLVAPMCGLTIAVALIVKMLKYRYALEQFRSTQPPEDVEVLLTDCRDFSQQMHPFVETHPLILLLSSLFLSAFLFDIAGDAVGWKAAMWAPALMWTLPLLLSLLRARFLASTSVACSSLIAAFPVPGEVELPSVHLDVGNDGSLGDLYGSGGDGGGDDKDDSRFSGTMLEARASSTLAPARASSSMDAAAAAAIVVDKHSDSSMALRLSHAHPPPLLALHLHPAARLSTVPVEPPVSEVSSP